MNTRTNQSRQDRIGTQAEASPKEYIVSTRSRKACDCRRVTARNCYEACHEAVGFDAAEGRSPWHTEWEAGDPPYKGCLAKHCRERMTGDTQA